MPKGEYLFKGLQSPKKQAVFGSANYQGTPCLYLNHCGPQGTARCWRDSTTHHCVECADNIWKGRFGLDINRLHPRYRRKALKFWSRVDIGEWDECWRWTYKLVKGQLYHIWPRKEIQQNWGFHPIRVMMWITWGDTARLGSTSLCGERRCMNPLHNLPLDIRHSARIEDYDEKWLNKELATLKEQLNNYYKDLENERLEKLEKRLSKHSKAIDPTVNDASRRLIAKTGGTTPFQNAFYELQERVTKGSHIIHSVKDLSAEERKILSDSC